MIKRYLNLQKLLGAGHSSFLFGPRGVGKTILSKQFLETAASRFVVDLLNHEKYIRYLREPGLFRKEIENKIKAGSRTIVLVDEIQKLPALLDEVHFLIEANKDSLQFLLTGSSARKLKRKGADLLAGRAWNLKLHPLSSIEMELDLSNVLRFGSLPGIYLSNADDKAKIRTLKAYVQNYVKEEILQEAIVRKADRFLRFLDLAAQMNGEPINFTQVAKDSLVSTKTAQEYFSILEDTLLVHRLDGWTHSIKKQIQKGPKYYFFDCGVINALLGELDSEVRSGTYRYGKLFESLVVQECFRYNDYSEKDYKIYYWRTNTGAEVDLVLQKTPHHRPIAVEVKSKPNPAAKDLQGLRSFANDNPGASLICFCTTPEPYRIGDIQILPWQQGLTKLFIK
jgi:predicted AAA+ superfamily ATPase